MPSASDIPNSTRHNTSCTECQRRKQKCSREWPCHHCQTRKVPHLCQFDAPKAAIPDSKTELTTGDGATKLTPSQKRKSRSDMGHDGVVLRTNDGDTTAADIDAGFEAMGYMPGNENFNLGLPSTESKSASGSHPSVCNSADVDKALRILPPRPYTDLLVKSFLHGANYHYYVLYPPFLMEQYNRWWAARLSREALNPELTCLILRVCACSLQYLDIAARQRLESELVESVQDLTDKYHTAAQDLSRALPPGRGGLAQVQQLLLTASWFKAEAKFVDSWHALGSAVREAQEQGMHTARLPHGSTEFDLEMRRRVWCILYTWDWQMSALLSRPLIINHADCSFELPNCFLENPKSSENPHPPSPIEPMVLQCDVIRRLSSKFGVAEALSPSNVILYRDEIMSWMSSFPPPLHTEPDTQFDSSHPWLVLQRAQLHAMVHTMMLHPLKPYLTRRKDDRSLRIAGVDCVLKLVQALRGFFEVLYPLNNKSHFILFGIFDTGATICSAIQHDSERRLPQRQRLIEAIVSTLEMLRKIHLVSPSGAVPYSILSRVISRLPLSAPETALFESPRKKAKIGAPSDTPELEYYDRTSRANIPTTTMHPNSPETRILTLVDLHSMETPFQMAPDDQINAEMEFGELGSLINWEALDFGPQLQMDLMGILS